MKYSFVGFDSGFNHHDNFMCKFLKNDEYTNNFQELDVLFIGSLLFNHGYESINSVKHTKCIKIMYITEPLEFQNEYCTGKIYRENVIDIFFGCVENNGTNSFKYPLWYDMRGSSLFHENVFIFENLNNYVNDCETVLNKRYSALVNNHDVGNTRLPIYNKLKDFGLIECPGKLLNNCSNEEINSLTNWSCLSNSDYFKLFKFVICPENFPVTIPGYITEKLANACFGGAIPIYYGFFGEVEEKIFNKKRILFYNPFDEESMNLVKTQVEFLLNNPNEFINFYKQPVFNETAYETVKTFEVNMYNMMKSVYKKLAAK